MKFERLIERAPSVTGQSSPRSAVPAPSMGRKMMTRGSQRSDILDISGESQISVRKISTSNTSLPSWHKSEVLEQVFCFHRSSRKIF
jgi:hypothetical protein